MSVLLETYAWTFTFIYVFFRFLAPTRFFYIPSKLISSFNLTDGFLFLPAGWLLYYITYYIQYRRKTLISYDPSKGFFADAPFVLNESNDSLGRVGYIQDLAKKIISTDTKGYSFAIGIIGQWGSGKTAFLKTLEEELKNNPDVIQIRFNPWITPNISNSTAIFFSDLANKLSEYDETLKTEITTYSRELLQSVDNQTFSFFKQLFDSSVEEKGMQDQIDLINDHINRLKKKVVVYIDDVDRLEKKEVIEVLRIVRNSANFSNTFFIVAFDKSYVTACINEALINNSENYLEKIFQLEYYLPPNPDKLIYQKALLSELQRHIPSNCQPILQYIENPSKNTSGNIFLSNFEILPPINNYIQSFRDVNRFMNVFLLNYDRIKHNIYLPDFISICLLRVKYPEVYRLLYYNRRNFLIAADNFGAMEGVAGELYLRLIEDNSNGKKDIELNVYLEKNYKELALNQKDTQEVEKLIRSIFNIVNSASNPLNKRSLFNHHMTISDSAYFDRYFDYSMAGRLDQQEFNEALKLPIENIEKKIEEWSTMRQISTDLIVKLENLTPDSDKDFFEKIIKAIVYLTYQPNPNDPRNLLSFDKVNFIQKLGIESDENPVIQNLYLNNKEEFKNFFKSLYLIYADKAMWGFIHFFAQALIKDYDDGYFILSHEELKDLIKDSFIASVESNQEPSQSLLIFYSIAIKLFATRTTSNGEIIPEGKGIEMTERLREVLEKNPKELLEFNIIRQRPNSDYVESGWHRMIFGSDEAFTKILESHANDPLVNEYIEFQNAFRPQQQPVKFQFNFLNPS
ncbi:KAP family P-loop NTPase fold protein [Paraflavitalea soli]|nr:P-loop NTPase fold protein [Paraflavitalea soli]